MALTNVGLRHLRSFVVLADELHFGRAARLYLSQPALSQTIEQLEDATGFRLVERTTRRVELTADGASLREDAVQLLAQFERMMERARASAAGMRGAIRVGYIIGAAVDVVPRVLRRAHRAVPDVKVQTTEFDFSRLAAGLDNGCRNVAIVRPPIDVRGAQLRTLATEPRVACLPESRRLAEPEEVSVYELLDEPIIAAPRHGRGATTGSAASR